MEESIVAVIDVKANVILLEPGDRTRYQILCAQTESQERNQEVTISLFGMRDIGASFTYSTETIRANWPGMAGKCKEDQVRMFPVSDIMIHLPGEIANKYTARAIVEAAAIWLSR